MKFISVLHSRTMLVVAKPVTYTLDPNRKVDIMIHSVASESPKGLLQCHKNSCLILLFTRRFSAETAVGDHFISPLPVKGLEATEMWFLGRMLICLQYFDAASYATGRASGV